MASDHESWRDLRHQCNWRYDQFNRPPTDIEAGGRTRTPIQTRCSAWVAMLRLICPAGLGGSSRFALGRTLLSGPPQLLGYNLDDFRIRMDESEEFLETTP